MNDMSAVIVPKSDQISADDFIAGPKTFTIEGVAINPGTEQPVSIKLVGEPRVWKPCKSMSRVLVQVWGADANEYTGRALTLYRDPKVKWGGMEVGGIRVSNMSHMTGRLLLQLTATKGKRAPHVVEPLVAEVRQIDRTKQTKAITIKANSPGEWVDLFIGHVNAAADESGLNALVASQIEWLDKLPTDLRTTADAAVSDRLAEFHPAEGRPDDAMGEGFTGGDEQTGGF